MFYFCTAEVSVEAQSDCSVNLNGDQPNGQVDNCDEGQSYNEPDDVDSADCPAVGTMPIDVVVLGAPVDMDMCCILDTDQPDDEFDIDSLTAGETSHLPLNTSAPIQHLAESLPCLFKLGCSLNCSHWSCSYDSVYVILLHVHEILTSMVQQVDPADAESGNVDFGELFNTLLVMAQSGQDSQFVHFQKFNLFKEQFCDQLSLADLISSKRHRQAWPLFASSSATSLVAFPRRNPASVNRLSVISAMDCFTQIVRFCFLDQPTYFTVSTARGIPKFSRCESPLLTTSTTSFINPTSIAALIALDHSVWTPSPIQTWRGRGLSFVTLSRPFALTSPCFQHPGRTASVHSPSSYISSGKPLYHTTLRLIEYMVELQQYVEVWCTVCGVHRRRVRPSQNW
jgi:hypothetical protein